MDIRNFLEVSAEVKEALENNRPVVALESTIISHGMPYPQNVETALEVEKIVRDNGAVPATIAIIDGKITVGLNKDQIEKLGKQGLDTPKASRRDLPVLLARGQDGATTVATTMIAAGLAGIKVFATGGIGGVHRGGENTMDISADLEELATTDVMVVCAGCKSILDIGLTLEYLETKGVPVISYKTDSFPAFFTRESGFTSDYRLDSTDDMAKAFAAKQACSLKGGMLIANPIPEEYSMDSAYISKTIEDAVAEAEELGIKGKDVTPFLLDKIQKVTSGQSLKSNIELVFNNVRLGCELAKSCCKLAQK